MPASAQTAPGCGLTLLLAVDVSSSVDEEEYKLQMGGLSRALVDPDVLAAIDLVGGIQLAAYEWSGRHDQTVIADWSYIAVPGDIIDFAEIVRDHPRGREDMPTAMGYALGFASQMIASAPLQCARTVIDVAGDGVNNEGFEPRHAYDAFAFMNVQVNGLVIRGSKPDPVDYYEQSLIYGAGAFVEIAEGFSDYEEAMKRKLVREILGGAVSLYDPMARRSAG